MGGESYGFFSVSGFAVPGKGPGSDINLLDIHFIPEKTKDEVTVDVVVDNLIDDWYEDVGIPRGLGVTFSIVETFIQGDVNSDGMVSIVDALMVAQYAVGLPVPGFNVFAADMDGNSVINIIDALKIAQYTVGPYLSLPS